MNKNNHIGEEDILRAIVDGSDLTDTAREHLAFCPACNSVKTELENDLKDLGEKAKNMAPLSLKRLNLPADEKKSPSGWDWGLRPALGAAVMATLVILVVWWPNTAVNPPGQNSNKLAGEMASAEILMDDVGALSENALSREYLDIAVETDEEPDDELMDFIIPIDENSSLS